MESMYTIGWLLGDTSEYEIPTMLSENQVMYLVTRLWRANRDLLYRGKDCSFLLIPQQKRTILASRWIDQGVLYSSNARYFSCRIRYIDSLHISLLFADRPTNHFTSLVGNIRRTTIFGTDKNAESFRVSGRFYKINGSPKRTPGL